MNAFDLEKKTNPFSCNTYEFLVWVLFSNIDESDELACAIVNRDFPRKLAKHASISKNNTHAIYNFKENKTVKCRQFNNFLFFKKTIKTIVRDQFNLTFAFSRLLGLSTIWASFSYDHF